MGHVSGPTMGLPGYTYQAKGPCDSCVGKIATRLAEECEKKYGITGFRSDKINPYWSKRPHYKAIYDAEVAKLPPADIRVQGETDSFGAEYHDLCHACHKASREAELAFKAEYDRCDTCGEQAITSPYRCADEGMCGPVYNDCDKCAKERRKREFEEYKRNADMGYDDW